MQHLMIDLETMGSRFDAPIVSIGAVFFRPETGELGKTFQAFVDIESAFQFGRANGSTVKWWLQQSDEARQAAIKGTRDLPFVLQKFTEFYKQISPDAAVWGNGATFDISILDYAYQRVMQKTPPWGFWLVRDCRTIKDIASHLNIDTNLTKGVAHTPLDDAKNQAAWVSAMWQGLKGSVVPAPVDEFDVG